MSDSAEIDKAIFATLNDATLNALVPDGAWWTEAPQSKTRFVLVALPDGDDVDELQDEAFEHMTYLIKAVVKGTSRTTADTAAARIRVLMRGLVGQAIPGYVIVNVRRATRVAYPDKDSVDPAMSWFHAGGLYEILAQPTA